MIFPIPRQKNNIINLLCKFIYFTFLLFLTANCSISGKAIPNTDSIEISNVIDLTSGLNNIQSIRLSEIADSVTFVPFETTSRSVMGMGQRNMIFSIPFIFYYEKYFDWNGRYRGTIIKKGQGSYEEPEGGTLIFTDNHFYSKGTKFIEYDITGNPTGKVRNLYSSRVFESNDFLRWGIEFSSVGENFFIYNYPTDVYFISKNFETVSSKKIIEANIDPDNRNTSFVGNHKFVTYYKNHIIFYSFINDTIFYVTDTDLEPRWIVNFDNSSRLSTKVILNYQELANKAVFRSGSIENTELIRLTDNKHKVMAVYETESYLFFQMTEVIHFAELRGRQNPDPYIILYDKHNGKTVRVKGKGFVDDLLGMDSFYPQLGVFDEKLITFIWPFELLNYIEECRDRGRELNPQLMTLSKKISPEDNPILILVHLKK